MANIAGSYDEQAEPSGDFAPIPVGTYRMKIIESDVEDISKKDSKGRCLKLTWQIETGAHDGRLVWQRLNMWAENMGPNTDKVIQIANSQFASIRQATGKIAPQDSSELHHIPCEVYVGLSKPQEGYNQQNEVKSVKAISLAPGAAQVRQAPAATQQRAAPPAATGASSAPWRRAS
jgi:hypothetical protein